MLHSKCDMAKIAPSDGGQGRPEAYRRELCDHKPWGTACRECYPSNDLCKCIGYPIETCWLSFVRAPTRIFTDFAGDGMRILVTGMADFDGSHVAQMLLARGDEVIGFDNLKEYYYVTLKHACLARLGKHKHTHMTADLADQTAVDETLATHRPQRLVDVAAQAGVRCAVKTPDGCVVPEQ